MISLNMPVLKPLKHINKIGAFYYKTEISEEGLEYGPITNSHGLYYKSQWVAKTNIRQGRGITVQ